MYTKEEHYEKIADGVMAKIFPYLIKDLANFYGNTFDGKSIVEIGCGPGHLLKEILKENFSSVYAVDISPDMLSRAKRRCLNEENLELVCAKAEKLPFQNELFDIVISRGSVIFWKDLEAAFKEIYRVLKPQGFALIGGGYGMSTPSQIVEDILSYYKSQMGKSLKPKLDTGFAMDLMESIGGRVELKTKPKQGFWLLWRKG